MAEQNNQAERAAQKFLPCPMPDCGSDLVGTSRFPGGIKAVSCGRCGMTVPETNNASAIERWNRQATLPASVDAEGLPPLSNSQIMDLYDEAIGKGGSADNIILNTVKAAIAADRRKQAALTQMIELGQEIGADQPLGVTDSKGDAS